MKRVRVCSWIGKHGESCPNLAPCPVHSRPRNASWSTDRDRRAQDRFRTAVLERDGHRCTRCHRHDVPLIAHHIRPGYDPSCGVTLCEDCHAGVDPNARSTTRHTR